MPKTHTTRNGGVNQNDVPRALAHARLALLGTSNDAEHDALAKLVEALEAREQVVVRVYICDGLLTEVRDLPAGITLRKIDMDTEGSMPEDTTRLTGRDRYDQENRRKHERGFVSEFEGGDQ